MLLKKWKNNIESSEFKIVKEIKNKKEDKKGEKSIWVKKDFHGLTNLLNTS